MTVNYTDLFTQLGAELKIMRKVEALFEHSHFVTNAAYSKRLLSGAYDNTVDLEEIALTNGSYSIENVIAPAISSLHTQQRGIFEQGFFPILDDVLDTTAVDQGAGAVQYVYDGSLTNGQVAILQHLGRFGALRNQMLTDSEYIQKNTITISAFESSAANQGYISTATSTIVASDHTLTGTLLFLVVDDTVGNTQFSVTNNLTKMLPDGTLAIGGDNYLTLGKSYQDGPTGLTVNLALGSVTESGDTAACCSSWVITNPVESDSNKGKVYIFIEREAASPIWLVQWYRDAALTSIVAQTTTDTTAGSVTLTITGPSGMSVALSFDRGAAAAGMGVAGSNTTVTVDIRSPRVGDIWRVPVSNNELGNFATKLAHRYRMSLPSSNPGTISDALATSVSIT